MTSPKVIGLPSYALETTDEPLPDKAASLQPEHGILATEGTEEAPVIPRQGKPGELQQKTWVKKKVIISFVLCAFHGGIIRSGILYITVGKL